MSGEDGVSEKSLGPIFPTHTTERVRLSDAERDELLHAAPYSCIPNEGDMIDSYEIVERIVAARVADAKIEVLRQMANEIRGSWTGAKCAEVLLEEVAVRERFDPNYRDDDGRE